MVERDEPPRASESRGLVRRLLGLSLEYRRECLQVFALQVVLLGLGVLGLGLSGVAVDVIRAALQPGAPAPRWPLDWSLATSLPPTRLLFAIGGVVLGKLQRLSYRFFDENATGSIVNRVTGDVQSLRSFVDGVLLQGLIMLISL